jgi:hypothetical protein
LVVRVIVYRDKDSLIGDVKIGIARWQPRSPILHAAGLGERHNAELLPILIHGTLETLIIFPQGGKVLVPAVRLERADHGGRIHESGKVVHMGIRVVTRDPLP